MFNWAASALLAASIGTANQAILSKPEQALWEKLRPSVVVLYNSGEPCGIAACISQDGYFIAHESALLSPIVSGRDNGGHQVSFSVMTTDRLTGLALLVEATGIPGLSNYQPIGVEAPGAKASKQFLTILPTGPVRSIVENPSLIAAEADSPSSIEIEQIDFDSPVQLLAGGLSFDADGNLAGVLGARLTTNLEPKRVSPITAIVKRVEPRGFGANAYGPSGLIVAFSPSPAMIRQVVSGFLAPDHRPRHPALGAVCIDGAKVGRKGALVVRVSHGSAADTAGLEVGDIIVRMGSAAIPDQVAFVRAILSQEVGATLNIVVERGKKTQTLQAVVGQLSD